MLTYQIILLVISAVCIIWGFYKFKNESFNKFVFSLWMIVWFIIIIITLFPSITTHFAKMFGIGRGLDSVYIVSILFLFYIVFKLYNKIEKQRKRIDDLVSELTLKENEK